MDIKNQNHDYFMRAAIQEALRSFDDGEVPIGAVIQKNGVIIGKGYNRMESIPDATAHAEIIAISAASSYLSTWRLNDCTIYVTLEPCMMCMGALLHARISRIVYGAADPRAGAIDSHFYKQEIIRSYGYFPEIISGVQSDECGSLISSFFKQIRKKS
jgi:tRNA(adenine34) deaminase